jgi:hypothetical protein
MPYRLSDYQLRRRPLADQSPPTFRRRFMRGLRYIAASYGPLIAILASSPALFYYGVQSPDVGFTGLMSIDGPMPYAVQAVTGPDLPRLKAARLAQRLPTPAFVKGIYVSAAAAGSQQMFAGLVDLVDHTELNTLVIDVKTDKGQLAFKTEDPALAPYVAKYASLGDLKEFTQPLHEKGIYLIARQFVFQDPFYAQQNPDVAVLDKTTGKVWTDNKGVSWVDPASEKDWAYNVAVARAVLRGGFDEVQFDYIRFPTDGKLGTMQFRVWDGVTPKADVMEKFYTYLDRELRHKDGARISADLFGLVTWNHDTDMNIGQRLDKAVRHFDYISPMVYPSHYPPGFMDFKNPADHPYEIVHESLVRAKQVTDPLAAEDKLKAEAKQAYVPVATMRPWIQDFDLGADYTPAMVRAQMKATTDAKGSGWLIWNARNSYTKEALDATMTETP